MKMKMKMKKPTCNQCRFWDLDYWRANAKCLHKDSEREWIFRHNDVIYFGQKKLSEKDFKDYECIWDIINTCDSFESPLPIELVAERYKDV